MLIPKTLDALGNQAWALWRRVGHEPQRAVYLACLGSIPQRTWSAMYDPERHATQLDVARRMLRRDALELDRQSRLADDVAALGQLPQIRRAAPVAPDPPTPLPHATPPLSLGVIRRQASRRVDQGRPHLRLDEAARAWAILWILVRTGKSKPSILRMGLGLPRVRRYRARLVRTAQKGLGMPCTWPILHPVTFAKIGPCGKPAELEVDRRTIRPDGRRGEWRHDHVCAVHFDCLVQREKSGVTEIK